MSELNKFPNEIIIEIFEYLDVCDIIAFSSVFPRSKCFLRDKQYCENFNFGRKFHMINFNTCKHIKQHVNVKLIRILNINCIYWIRASQLRNLLAKMKNLTKLTAVDTELGIDEMDCLVYNSNLEELALTIDLQYVNGTNHLALQLPNLKRLLLKYVVKYPRPSCMHGFQEFLKKFDHLRELWLVDVGQSAYYQYNNYYSEINIRLPRLECLILKTKTTLPNSYDLHNRFFSNLFLENQIKIPACDNNKMIINNKIKQRLPQHTFQRYGEMLLGKAWLVSLVDLFKPNIDSLEEKIQLLAYFYIDNKLKCTVISDNTTHCITKLTELDFEHYSLSSDGVEITNISLFLFKNIQTLWHLRRLRIHSCLLEQDNKPGDIFKSKYPDLHELEVHLCVYSPKRRLNIRLDYKSISKLIYLRKLSLEVLPLLRNGPFLYDILKKCQYLESLRILSNQNRYILNDDLINSLKYGKNLKDLCFFTDKLLFDSLLKSFIQLETKTIQRIFLKCNEIISLDINNLKSFLNLNPQLILFIIIITNAKENEVNIIQDIFAEHRKIYSYKILCSVKDNLDFNMCYTNIPKAHYDFLFCDSYSGLDPYNDF